MKLTLKRTEVAAHGASIVAVLLTVLMVGTDQATEANPVSAWIIAHTSIYTWAVATPVLVASIFAICRWVHRRGGRRLALMYGSLTVGAFAIDAAGNLMGIAVVGAPDTVRWGVVGRTATILIGLAVLLVWRPDPRAAVARVPMPSRQVSGAVLLVVMLALSGVPPGIFGPGAMLESVSTVSAGSPSSVQTYSGSSAHRGVGYSPEHDIVYHNMAGTLKAYYEGNGTKFWSTSIGTAGRGAAFLESQDAVYAHDDAGVVEAYTWDGTQKWTTDTSPGTENANDLTVNETNDEIYAANGGAVTALNADGSKKWTRSFNAIGIADGPSYVWAVDNINNDVYKLDRSDGSTVASKTLSNTPVGISASSDGVYVLTGAGNLKKFDKSLTEQYSINVGSINVYDAVEVFDSEDVVYVGNENGRVIELTESGTENWNTSFHSDKITDMVVTGQAKSTNNISIFTSSDDNSGKKIDSGTTAGVKVSGTVEDTDGNTINNADLTLKDSGGSTVSTTTSNSTGGYKFSGVSDGNYTIEAGAPGYRNETSSEFEVAGAPVTKNFTLSGNLLVKVRDQGGDPVKNATVKVVAWNNSTFTGSISEIRDKIDDLQQKIANPTPPDWTDQAKNDFSVREALKGSGVANPRYIALHRESDWKTGSTKVIFGGVTTTGGFVGARTTLDNDPELDRPKIIFAPDEEIWVSCWEGPPESQLYEDNVDGDLPGLSAGCNATITPLGAGGEALEDPIDVTTVDVYDPLVGSPAQAGVIQASTLGEGFYRVRAGHTGQAYVFAIAPGRDPNNIQFNVVQDWKDKKGDLSQRAQKLQDFMDQDKVDVLTATTNSAGIARVNVDGEGAQRAASVQVIAYKSPAKLDSSAFTGSTPNQQDIREFYNSKLDDYRQSLENPDKSIACGANTTDFGGAYAPADVARTDDLPTTVTAEVVGAGAQDFASIMNRLCALQGLEDFLRANGMADQIAGILDSLENKSASEIRSIYSKTKDLVSQNPKACKQALLQRGITDLSDCTSGAGGTPGTGGDGYYGPAPGSGGGNVGFPDDPSDSDTSELRSKINDLQASLEQVQSTIDSGDTSKSVGNNTVSLSFPFDHDLSKGQVAVFVDYSNGTTSVLNTSSEYVSIQSSFGGDTVRIEDYPLGDSSAAVANFRVKVATPDGTGSSEETVKNPTFSGQVPGLSSIRASTMMPGPDETVTVGVNAERGSPFGGVKELRVTHPNGTTSTVTSGLGDGAGNFSTNGAGTYRVQAIFSSSGGQNFTETILLRARSTDISAPPSIRPQSGPTGRYAVVSGVFQNGHYDVEQGGKQVTVAGVIASDADVPTTSHVYLEGTEMAPTSTTTVRFLRGEQETQIRERSTAVVHYGVLSEDALIYREGDPVPYDGESGMANASRTANGTVVRAVTEGDGSVKLKVINDPTFVQSIWFDVQTTIPDISILSLLANLGPVPGGVPALPVPSASIPAQPLAPIPDIAAPALGGGVV